jgi:hypothetical protein
MHANLGSAFVESALPLHLPSLRLKKVVLKILTVLQDGAKVMAAFAQENANPNER